MTDASWAAFAVVGAALITGLAAYGAKRSEAREAGRRAAAGESVQQRAQIADEGERIRAELRADLSACRAERDDLEAERDRWYDMARALRRERDSALEALEQTLSLGKAGEE